ncbi:Alpha/Beta hydrolase protein [Mrakia frigida]|uniref:serine-type carboxypeptidase n=1 Tax=Mrakia frigida TaxID=29902 RepID=UPI003FCC14E5
MASTLPPASSFYVPTLPTLEFPLNQHPTHPLNVWAGLLDSDPGEDDGGGKGATGREAKIFFMLVNPRRKAGKNRLIFWFNGGPGCSSFDGSMMEIGPFRMDPSNPGGLMLLDWGGWEEFAGVVFVDQPPGTGMSTTPTNGYLHELHQASAHLVHFIKNFLEVFPEWKGVDTYLTGESYAGQYIPYFADALLNTPHLPNFPLKGIAIGNGWIDPREQYPGYVDFAYEHGLVKAGTPQAADLTATLAVCQAEIDKHTDMATMPINMNNCGQVMSQVTERFVQEVDGRKVCMNVYDVRLTDEYPACGMNWPPELSDVYTYLRRTDVVAALHATEHKTGWVECNGAVGGALGNSKSPASIGLFPSLLERIPILLFAGSEDLICNHKGIERLVERLEWNGAKGLQSASVNEWYVNDTLAGTWTSARNLTYVKVSSSSHMVAYDVPQVAHDMILRFMDVDFSLLVDGTPGWESRIGTKEKTTAVQGSLSAADGDGGGGSGKGGSSSGTSGPVGAVGGWEAFYNASSALTVLLFIAIATALFFFFRARRRRRSASAFHLSQHNRTNSLPLTRRDLNDAEEREPLGPGSSAPGSPRNHQPGSPRGLGSPGGRGSKGKGKTVLDESESEGEVMFDLGEEEEDDGGWERGGGRRK